jgi:hypothetical protein
VELNRYVPYMPSWSVQGDICLPGHLQTLQSTTAVGGYMSSKCQSNGGPHLSVFLEKLVVAELLKILPAFSLALKFIFVITKHADARRGDVESCTLLGLLPGEYWYFFTDVSVQSSSVTTQKSAVLFHLEVEA